MNVLSKYSCPAGSLYIVHSPVIGHSIQMRFMKSAKFFQTIRSDHTILKKCPFFNIVHIFKIQAKRSSFFSSICHKSWWCNWSGLSWIHCNGTWRTSQSWSRTIRRTTSRSSRSSSIASPSITTSGSVGSSFFLMCHSLMTSQMLADSW